MIDPLTAFAAAQAAVKGIQAAIKLGKDIHGISGDLLKFFEAKDVVAKAAVKPKGFGQSDTARALEIVMHAKQLRDAESELKDMLVWSGNADVWESVMLERNKIVAERKAEEARAAAAKAARAEEISDIVNWGLGGLCIGGTIAFVIFLIMQLVE